MGDTTITQEQIDILASAGYTKERIKSGELSPTEKKILKDYNRAEEYLTEKYGEGQIVLSSCGASGVDGFDSYFYGSLAEDSEATGQIHVSTDDDDSLEITDSFYMLVMRDTYSSWIEEAIQEWGENCTELDVEIDGMYGEDFTSNMTPQKAVDEGKYVHGSGYLTIAAQGRSVDECEKSAEQLRAIMQNRKMYGSFCLIFADEDTVCQKWIDIKTEEDG